jgi:transcriptional regulator with XRE-family HTH domain
MNSVGKRILELRKKLNFTQKELADKIGMTYVQIGRYEKRGAIPSSDVLRKLADALNTTTDYLMNGAQDEKAAEQIQDKELLNLFKDIEKLDNNDKTMIKTFLDALVTKRKIQHLAIS